MSAYGSYQNAYRRASVNTMDQGKLIVMLYDGAIRNINFALQHLKDDEVEKTHNCLVKAKNIGTAILYPMPVSIPVMCINIAVRKCPK